MRAGGEPFSAAALAAALATVAGTAGSTAAVAAPALTAAVPAAMGAGELASIVTPAVLGAGSLATGIHGALQDAPEAAKPNLPSTEVGSLGAQAAPLKFGGPGGRMQTQQNRSNTALAMLG